MSAPQRSAPNNASPANAPMRSIGRSLAAGSAPEPGRPSAETAGDVALMAARPHVCGRGPTRAPREAAGHTPRSPTR